MTPEQPLRQRHHSQSAASDLIIGGTDKAGEIFAIMIQDQFAARL